ncbi:MAG: VOC family protein [Gemmatimonadales bacterium]
MGDPLIPRVGGVLSADIAVPEHERETRFYSRVLGTGADPLWREDLMNNRGTPVIGLGAQTEKSPHLPLQWMPHIQVADVAASLARARALGGSALMYDDSGESQWAVLVDPNGAAFGIIPLVSAEAIPRTEGAGRVGRIAWLDLTISNASATRDFYRQVVGWTVKDVAMEDAGERYADYSMLSDDGRSTAGVCHARGANLGIPPVWMLYLPVGDLAESIDRVHEEGGTVIRESRGPDGEYASAVIRDPVGACPALVPG